MAKGGNKYAQKGTRIFRVTVGFYSNLSNWWAMVNLDIDSILTESVRRSWNEKDAFNKKQLHQLSTCSAILWQIF